MKNVIILTGINLPDEGIKISAPRVIHPISRKFRIFVREIASRSRAWLTVPNVSIAIAAIAILVGLCAAALVSETDSIESRATLAASSAIGIVALGIALLRNGASTTNG